MELHGATTRIITTNVSWLAWEQQLECLCKKATVVQACSYISSIITLVTSIVKLQAQGGLIHKL